jgi:hypothetical protein
VKGLVVSLFLGAFAAAAAAGGALATTTLTLAQAATGTITGHVRITGKLPGNSVIRMGVDPKCNELNKGKQAVNEVVKATIDGSLANVFVRLEGKFPKTPIPTTPVTLNQSGCIYSPRVTGVRLGQSLQIRNSDNLFHNVHSRSDQDNSFNLAQPKAGVVDTYTPKKEEVMMRLGCDVHRWMAAYIGVVAHPYFATSDGAGKFTMVQVPPGTYTIHAWHEKFGAVKKTVTVKAGGTATADFTYTGNEKA